MAFLGPASLPVLEVFGYIFAARAAWLAKSFVASMREIELIGILGVSCSKPPWTKTLVSMLHTAVRNR